MKMGGPLVTRKTGAITTGILLALTLAGCAPMQWIDPRTGSTAGADAALEECHRLALDEAWRSQWYYGWSPHLYEPFGGYPGWRYPFGHDESFSHDLYFQLQNFCMRSRGFRLVEKPEQ